MKAVSQQRAEIGMERDDRSPPVKGPTGTRPSHGQFDARLRRDHGEQHGVAGTPVDIPKQFHAELDGGLHEP
jgi:hypothetical protein